ncbi:MAG: YkgJ family cysteine cluster protein [Candidatus Micrarchaeota archaeon]|nr:YkgJ family cysteine cluster protein [Candidatus Micrarchaeota archaeon]
MSLTACQRCNKCCTSFGVCLTIFDIIRICNETGKNPAEFIVLIDDYQPRERTESAVKINREMKILVLKHSETRVCSFFKNGGCSIYDFRPYLCRTYPFVLKNGLLSDVQNRACEALWYPKGENKEKYLKDLAIYYGQIDYYKKIVDEWNAKHVGTLEDFLSFAIKTVEKQK